MTGRSSFVFNSKRIGSPVWTRTHNSTGTLLGEHLWYDGAKAKWGYYLWELTDGRVLRHAPQEGLRANESFVRDGSGAMYGWRAAAS